MTKRILNIALLGQGFMGRAHSNAYQQVTHFFDLPVVPRRKVICGRNLEGLEKMAATWGWEEVATDWRSLVERKDIDAVDIAVPNALHAPIAIAAAEAGKIVFCEKPLAGSLEEAQRMAAAARNVPNMVWFNYRRVPAVALSRKLIDEGRLGRIFHYRATYLQEWGNDPTRLPGWKMQKSEAGSGVLGDLASHLVDLALYLNGAVSGVSALMHTFAPNRDVDDATLFLARFENGSIGSFEASRYAVGCKNRNAFEIHGSQGALHFDLERLNYLEFVDATEVRDLQGPRSMLVSNEFWKPGHVVGYEHTFISALADFCRSLTDGTPFHPNFDDALRVQHVLQAVETSAGQGRWVAVD